MRRMVVVLIAIALGAGVFALWPRGGDDPTPDTEAAGTSTTTETTLPSTTTSLAGTTTTSVGSHVVETVAEAEEILRDLWFGWFEGIYNADEDRIREVVGNPDQVAEAVAAFGDMEFEAEPRPEALTIAEIEILHSDRTCLAVWANIDASPIIGASNDGVHVFIRESGRWLFISQWASREELWQDDCESQPLS